MAHRSYMLTGLEEGTDREGLIRVLRELEALDEVCFVEAVVGPYDLLVMAESEAPPEDLAAQLRRVDKIREVVALKVSPVGLRERMWKNLQQLPGNPTV